MYLPLMTAIPALTLNNLTQYEKTLFGWWEGYFLQQVQKVPNRFIQKKVLR